VLNDTLQPGTERVQALADISGSALCCYSNETHALTANPPNNAQPLTIPTTYIRVHAVVWECSKGQTANITNIHFAMPHVKFNK